MAEHGSSSAWASGPAPSVTVVIPTFNRSALLPRTLSALGKMRCPPPSTIVVENGSEPQHEALNRPLVQSLGFTYLSLKENIGPGGARNRGLALADSELVAFLDDDCAPAEDWLSALTGPFRDADASALGAVGGKVLSHPPHNWVSRFCAASGYSTGVQPTFTNAATANACFRRAVVEEVGAFDEGFREGGGDDPDLSRRVREAGYELRYVPEAIVYHAEIDRFGELVRHLYHRGLGEARGKRKEGRSHWVLLRASLFPVFCLRRAGQTWRASSGKASFPARALYAALETMLALIFVSGSVAGLARGHQAA